MNLVMCKRLNPGELHEQVHQVQELVQQPGAPLFWALNPDMSHAGLVPELEAQAWRFIEQVWGMAMDLDQLPDLTRGAPPGLHVERASTPECIQNFIDVLTHESQPAAEDKQRWKEFEVRLTSKDAGIRADNALPWERYVGYLDGEAVATESMFFGKRSAGLYHVATLPQARGGVIGTYMTHIALKDGLARGYRLAVLIATPMGINIYRKLGFEVYSTLDLFKRPEASDLIP